jgi:hypothetical protein
LSQLSNEWKNSKEKNLILCSIKQKGKFLEFEGLELVENNFIVSTHIIA